VNRGEVRKSKSSAWPRKQSDLYRQVGTRLRALRQERSITQQGLAEAVGMTRTSLTNIEQGRQKLLLHTLVDLATALQVLPAELLPPQFGAKLKTDTHA
jgi:transcriptional regulator with XRE-family HTH domain